jgi:hypothetical protein
MSLVVQIIKTKRGAKLGFAAGLRWAVLDDGQAAKRRQSLRHRIRTQANAIGASRYTTVKTDNATYVGLFSEPAKGKTGIKNLMSLAMLMREIASENREESEASIALLMQPEGFPDKRVLIVIQGGLVTVDVILDRQRAIDELMTHLDSGSMTVLSEHPEITHPHRVVTWDEITSSYFASTSKKVNQLKALPYSLLSLGLLGLSVVLIGAGVAYHQIVRAPEIKRLKALQSAQQDQTPSYTAEAFSGIAKSGWEKKDLLQFFQDKVLTQPYLVSGWSLQSVNCDPSSCSMTWLRQGGTTIGLGDALPGQKIDVAASSLDKTTTTFEHPKAALASFNKGSIKTLNDSLSVLRPVLQQMANAGVSASLGEVKRWAVIDVANVRQDAILSTMDLELTFAPHQLEDVLQTLPDSLVAQSFRLSVGSGEAKNPLRIALKGKIYVAQTL